MAHHECRNVEAIWSLSVDGKIRFLIFSRYYIIVKKFSFSQVIKLSSERTNKHCSNRIHKFVQRLNNVNLFKHSYFSNVHLSHQYYKCSCHKISNVDNRDFPLLCLGLVMSRMYYSLWSKGDFKAVFLKASGAPRPGQ